ncbi:MAG: transcriptional regulator [Acidobacteriota bacterium]|nr:transcriptional regulator [Acidobacteriota bacterium]
MQTSTERSFPHAAKPPMEIDPAAFKQNFNRRHFPVRHNLSDHPLFQLPRLIELARDTANSRPGDLYYDLGDVRVDQRWDTSPVRALPVDESIRRIESAGAWIILKKAERDPEYRELLERCMANLLELTGREFQKQMKVQEAIVFVTSPNRVTSYHIDSECNFILQIRGEKDIYVFDQNDRDVVPEQELERFWAVDTNAGTYKPQYQDRSETYRLGPGRGVHVPVNAPHWLKNGNNISITLSINFRFHDSARANLYRANYLMRKFGIAPAPPGISPGRDAMKRSLMGGVLRVKGAVPSSMRGLFLKKL